MPRKSQPEIAFSDQLEKWLHGKQPKTLDTLITTFGERSFAVIMMLLMLLPALPIPTAGHVFEAVVMIIAAEQVIGLKTLWLPKFLSSRVNLATVARSKTMQRVLNGLRWLEAKSNPRGKWVFSLPLMNRLIGLIVIGYTLTAFLAPPFSMLDTLPSLGVVLMSLAILLDDAILLVIGLLIGALGVFLAIFFGEEITHYVKHHLFHKA